MNSPTSSGDGSTSTANGQMLRITSMLTNQKMMTATGKSSRAVCGEPSTRSAGLRLALPGGVLRGPDKYKVLESRRRRAQRAARRVLDLIDASERGGAVTRGGTQNA